VKREQKKKAGEREVRTFEVVAKRWFALRKSGWVKSYGERVWARIKDDLISQFGTVPIAEVDSSDVLRALRKIEARGALEMAKRVKQYVDDIFKYARSEGWVSANPTDELYRALAKNPPKKRRAALKPVEMPEFMGRLAAYDGRALTKLAFRLTLLTFVRTSETRFAVWSEFEGLDGPEPLWRIPAERMKMRHEHLVPLSRQAVAALEELRALRLRSPLLFPAATKERVISQNTMIFALYRMGYHGRAPVHGFRGTASSLLNVTGVNGDWVERQLAHSEQDEIRASYNAAEWLPQRRRMMQWWADWLDAQSVRGARARPRLVAG
jgi:integrase